MAVDTPFFPSDLAARLLSASAGLTGVVLAADDDGLHPTFAFWPVSVLAAVSSALGRGEYRLGRLAEVELGGLRVVFAGRAFFNVNTPGDLAAAEARLAGGRALTR